MSRSEKSEDEQGYTVTEDEQGYAVKGRTEVQSRDEPGYTVTGRTVVKNQKMNRGTQSPGEPWYRNRK